MAGGCRAHAPGPKELYPRQTCLQRNFFCPLRQNRNNQALRAYPLKNGSAPRYPREDVLAPVDDLDPVAFSEPAELVYDTEEDEIDLPLTPQEQPPSLSPYEMDDAGLSDAEDRGLADFFEALTDDTGEVAPIAEPDEFLASGEEPAEAAIDPDLARLMETEDDSGPDLPLPPWTAMTPADESGQAKTDEMEDLPSWKGMDDLEALGEGDAVPVVDANDETYESLPAWSALSDSTPIDDRTEEPKLPDWGWTDEDEASTGPAEWDHLGALDSPEASGEELETPAWALPADEGTPGSGGEDDQQKQQDWSVDPPAPTWMESASQPAGAFTEDDDFLADLRRSAAVPLESKPITDPPLSDIEDGGDTGWDFGSEDYSDRMESVSQPVERPERVAAGWEMTALAAKAQKKSEAEAEEALDPAYSTQEEIYVPPASDPAPGQRYRVVTRGERVVFPGADCAHCGKTPVKGKLSVAGTLPRGQNLGQRRPTHFDVPLCASCRGRAAAKSDEARAAQLQAHLISGIIGMVLIVGALALDIINPRDLSLIDLFLGLILLIVGYSGPAFFLLNRVGNFIPPVDARYVRTTLLVPSETQGLETAFEWRNNEYAQRFIEANQANALGNVSSIKDRIT